VTNKLLAVMALAGVLIGAGSATALSWGGSGLNKPPVDCNLEANKSLPACATPPTLPPASAG